MRLLNITFLFLFFSYYILASNAFANNPLTIKVIVTEYNDITRQYISDLQQTNIDQPQEVILLNDFITGNKCDTTNCLYIAVGHKVLNTLSSELKTAPILSVLTSSITFNNIYKNSSGNLSAIYAEPSLKHQLELIKTIYKKNISIGVLYSDKSQSSLHQLEQLTENKPFTLIKHKISKTKDVTNGLQKIASANVLLAVPDSTIYNNDTFRQVILTTYRRNQPIIGFSRNFVSSGALASSYSSIEHIAIETRFAINRYEKFGKLPNAFHANKHGIAVNNEVATSLGVTIRSDDFLNQEFDLIKGIRYVNRD